MLKQEKKKIEKIFDEKIKKYGYKKHGNTYYKKINKYFVIVITSLIKNKLNIMILLKRYLSDDYLWDIINMSSNKNEPESLRAIGAFSAPKILYKNENVDNFDIKQLILDINNYTNENVLDITFNHYIKNSTVINSNEIRLLYYVEIGEYEKALDLAIEQNKLGNRGGFENEGKTFYKWSIEYLKNVKLYKKNLV